MKNKLKALWMLMLCTSLCISGCATRSIDINNSQPTASQGYIETGVYEQMDALTVYTLKKDTFDEFIAAPTCDKLNAQGKETYATTYYKNISSIIRVEDNGYTCEAPEGTLRICLDSTIPVYASLIEFAGLASTLSAFLHRNGITGNIDCYTTVYCPGYPVTVWVEIDDEHYFITVDERFDDYWERADQSDYVYRLYKQDEYKQLVSSKAMQVLINADSTACTANAKVEGNVVLLPFVAILQALDVDCQWDSSMSKISISVDNIVYVLNPAEHSFVKQDNLYNIILPPPGGRAICRIDADEVYIDSYSMGEILKLMEASVEIDYETMLIRITTTP